MLRAVILKDILRKPRLASQYTSYRLMSAKQDGQNEEPMATKTPLALPATADSDSIPTAEVNSSFKLSEMGPVVINENGTMSRIDNWHEMSDIEKANVNRILLKRNKARLEKLKKEREAAGNAL